MPRQTPFDMAHDPPMGEEATVTAMTVTHAPPSAATGDYPESTLSLRLDVDGVGVSWTLRGTDESMAKRLPRILEYLKRLQAKLPAPLDRGPEPAPDVIRGQAESRPAPPAPYRDTGAPPLEEREDWCPIHNKPLIKQSNARGSWWSHQVPGNGWCRGKRRKAGA